MRMAQNAEDCFTGFLRSVVINTGECILKAVAPEIDAVIAASQKYITENALDLAKAVDLSGVFISSSLDAFPLALQLARTLTSVIGEDEDKSVLETIEWLDKHAGPYAQEAKKVLENLDSIIKTGKQLEKEANERVRIAAISAYQALEEVVENVLKIEPGSARIGRVDPSVLTKLKAVVESFENLRNVSITSAWKLGDNSAAVMSFGGNSKIFIATLEKERQELMMKLKNNMAASQRHNDNLAALGKSADTYIKRRADARADLAQVTTTIASFLDPSIGEALSSTVSSTTTILEKNWRDQVAVYDKIRALHILDTIMGWTIRALDAAKASAERLAQEFNAKFGFITHALQRSDKLSAGLRGLANMIGDTEFHTTRDSSLRVVLAVLEDYHLLRHDYYALEIPGIEEHRIHRAIVDRLGRDAVMKLVEPPPADDMDDDINNL